MILTIPWPPSVNHYWRKWRNHMVISREGRMFRKNIRALLGGGRKPPFTGSIALAMDAFPPDRRRRDLDNLLKSTQDSLAHAGAFEDDSQVDLLVVRRCETVSGGRLVVQIDTFPLRRCPLCGSRYPQAENEHFHDN